MTSGATQTHAHSPLLFVPPPIAAIGLGANLPSLAGPPRATLAAAIGRLARLPLTQLMSVSSFRVTRPEGPGTHGQPAYVNACAGLQTLLTPRTLLAMLLDIERDFGRIRTRDARNAPRTLDLDLLLCGDLVLEDLDTQPAIRLPHARLHERRFVLEPLAEILPDLVVPPAGANETGMSVRTLLERLPPVSAP